MIVKEKDPIDEALQQLEAILQQPNLPAEVKARAQREKRNLLAGARGENNAAYFINFYYHDSPNWAVIHDLRLEHKGRVAQIDHLLINRVLEFYVLESKNFSHGIKITEHGEFLVWGGRQYYPIESPIEQNRRHMLVLEEVLKDHQLLPRRLGLTLTPTMRSYVLVSPKSRLIRPPAKRFDTSTVIKMDRFYQQLQQEIDRISPLYAMGALTKVVSPETLLEIANRLAGLHRPAPIDYFARFNLPRPQEPARADQAEKKRYFCAKCGKRISRRVAIFCFQNKGRFGGRAYCFDCQKAF